MVLDTQAMATYSVNTTEKHFVLWAKHIRSRSDSWCLFQGKKHGCKQEVVVHSSKGHFLLFGV